MGLVVGFTGTREGMTFRQARTLERLLRTYGPTELHHGDCVGADEEAHYIASEVLASAMALGNFRIIVHPPVKEDLRARCQPAIGAILEPKTYNVRNREIVLASDVVIAAPADDSGKGGTWQTIEHAIKFRKELVIVHADGAAHHLQSQDIAGTPQDRPLLEVVISL